MIAWRCARKARAVASDEEDWLGAPVTIAALGVGVLAFALQLFVDFHFKIPALAMTFAVVTALIVGRSWRVDESPRSSSTTLAASVVLAVAVVLGTWLRVVPAFAADALRYRARQRVDRLADVSVESREYRENLATSRTELAQAVVIDSSNAQAWADVAYVASLRAHILPQELPALALEAEAAGSRAVTIAPACVEFWIRRGVARDMQGRWVEGSLDLVHATTLAPCASWVWFYYADHLSRKASEQGLAEAALALCLRLDPGNPDGLALRQRLAISRKAPP